MNANRLKSLLGQLLRAEKTYGIQASFEALGTALANLANQPQQPSYQITVSEAFKILDEHLRDFESDTDEATWERLKDIGADGYYRVQVVRDIEDEVARNAMTPAVVSAQVSGYAADRSLYIDSVRSVHKNLSMLGIEESSLEAGTAEIGFQLPRNLFKNELDGLISELRALKRIIRAFSELSTGAAEPINVRQISTSDPLFFFGLSPITIAAIGASITWALNTWKQAEEIRKVRREVAKLDQFTADEVSGIFDAKIREIIDTAVEERLTEILGSAKTGRKAEQRIDLDWALRSIFARIERGMRVEIEFLEPPNPEDSDADISERSTAADEVYQQLHELIPGLVFPAPERKPVLKLPPVDSPTRKARSKATIKSTEAGPQ